MVHLFLLSALMATAYGSKMDIYNNCPFTIWPGIQGNPLVVQGGFKLGAGTGRVVDVPNGWKAARIWARTGCNDNFDCETGFCGNKEQCEGRGGRPPVSLAEFTLKGAGNQDFYDVSLVDGYNIPVFIVPKEGTYNPGGGQFECKRAGGCNTDVNSVCPPELALKAGDRTVGCKSACLAFNTDEYCCRGAHGKPESCKPDTWPKNYAKIFKDACPTAYSYAYDDHSSTFTCRGKNGGSPDYYIQFC